MSQPIVRQVLRQTAEGGQDAAPLTDHRPARAYVLLGDPGAGKTFSFEAEAAACRGHYLRASAIEAAGASGPRRALAAQEWHPKTTSVLPRGRLARRGRRSAAERPLP